MLNLPKANEKIQQHEQKFCSDIIYSSFLPSYIFSNPLSCSWRSKIPLLFYTTSPLQKDTVKDLDFEVEEVKVFQIHREIFFLIYFFWTGQLTEQIVLTSLLRLSNNRIIEQQCVPFPQRITWCSRSRYRSNLHFLKMDFLLQCTVVSKIYLA